MENADKTIVSLFDYTGIWSRPYREAGYQVLQIDIQHGQDIYTTAMPDSAHGIILQPPCTDFASSGARWFAEKDADGRTSRSVDLVLEALRWVDELNPFWWVLENPVGRIHKLVPRLGRPTCAFQPYEFGEPYSKKTCLWGHFNPNLRKTPVRPEGNRPGQPNAWYSKAGGKSLETKNYRSAASERFAVAFFEANP